MEQCTYGMSTGTAPQYVRGPFATAAETVRMLRVVRDFGGVFASHTRNVGPDGRPDRMGGYRTMLEQALAAGAKFIVSPGLSESVAKICKEKDVPYYPGCVTPTEIMKALELGITTVKFFPANVYGGLKALKALSAPFPQVKFIPTGGVDRSNIDEFLAFDKIAAIGGSFFVKEALEKMENKV